MLFQNFYTAQPNGALIILLYFFFCLRREKLINHRVTLLDNLSAIQTEPFVAVSGNHMHAYIRRWHKTSVGQIESKPCMWCDQAFFLLPTHFLQFFFISRHARHPLKLYTTCSIISKLRLQAAQSEICLFTFFLFFRFVCLFKRIPICILWWGVCS